MKDILRKIKLFDVIRAILLMFFLGVLLYPTVSDYLGRIHSSKAITSYNDEVKGIDKATKNKMLKEAQEYNQSLVNTKLYDPFYTTGKPSEENGDGCEDQEGFDRWINGGRFSFERFGGYVWSEKTYRWWQTYRYRSGRGRNCGSDRKT